MSYGPGRPRPNDNGLLSVRAIVSDTEAEVTCQLVLWRASSFTDRRCRGQRSRASRPRGLHSLAESLVCVAFHGGFAGSG